MHLTRLRLTHFRNYAAQEFDLERGTVLLLGQNAQGTTNILEAIFLLATGRSERSESDADYVAWDARDETQPFAQISGTVARGNGDATVELTVVGRVGAKGLVASKRFKLNGVARRATDVAGVRLPWLFTTDDMELVKGGPSGRRRYLDVMLAQADRAYGRALSRYNKVVTQRNALLKRIQEGGSTRAELSYWDDELSNAGSVLLHDRAVAVEQLRESAAAAHARLSGERERFELAYLPRGVDGWTAEEMAAKEPH